MTLVTGVDLVTVRAQELEASAHFSGTVLGLPFVKQWGEMPAKGSSTRPATRSGIHHRYGSAADGGE